MLWIRVPWPKTLEVTVRDESHLILEGRATFDLPTRQYRVDGHCGTFCVPAVQKAGLKASETRTVTLNLTATKGVNSACPEMITSTSCDPVFLGWLEVDAMQYGFGDRAEARRAGFSIRFGVQARSHSYGQVVILGTREILRPLGIGTVYANSPEAYPFPSSCSSAAGAEQDLAMLSKDRSPESPQLR